MVNLSWKPSGNAKNCYYASRCGSLTLRSMADAASAPPVNLPIQFSA